jgi:hypothetical protein
MKLNDIVLAENSGLFTILRTLPLRSREHRYSLRKGLEDLGRELKIAFDERDSIIAEYEPKTKQLTPTHSKYGEAIKRIMDFWESEPKAKIEACIYPEDLAEVAMSVQQEAVLEALGLVIAEKKKPAAPAQRAARMHVPAKKRK